MTHYYYSRIKIILFSIFLLVSFPCSGIYFFLNSNNITQSVVSIILITLGLFLIMLYRRIILAVLMGKPALTLTADSVQYLGSRKFTWNDIEYYRLVNGILKSSIEIKIYGDKEEAIQSNRTMRCYLDKLPLISFDPSKLIVDLTFIEGSNEFIVQSLEKYDLIGQESQRFAS